MTITSCGSGAEHVGHLLVPVRVDFVLDSAPESPVTHTYKLGEISLLSQDCDIGECGTS